MYSSTIRRFFRRSSLLQRIETFLIPQPGEGIAEVEILKWLASPSDKVSEYQILCEARSDKGFIEYKSPYEGVITEILKQPEQMAEIGEALYKIEIDDQKYPPKQSHKKPTEKKTEPENPQPQKQSLDTYEKVLTTPAVRHIAKSKGIDLSKVKATGKGGRVLKEDLIAYMEQGSAQAAPHPTPQTAQVQPTQEDQVIKVSSIQRAMIKSMTESLSIPHLTLMEDIFMDNLIELKNSLKKDSDVKITYLPFFMKAVSVALRDYPIMNSVLLDNKSEILLKSSHNISFAMDSPIGLLVPNVKNCQNLSIYEIAKELQRLQSLGNQGKISEEDLSEGTISLSNIGSIGGTYARPVLYSPQVFIGALGATRPRLEKLNGEILERQVLTTSWSADHRIIDGATTARFVQRWKELIENPTQMLLHLR